MHEQGFMCGGLYWVGVDFTTIFCVRFTNLIDGKEKNHFFFFFFFLMFVHSVLLVCLVLENVKRKLLAESYLQVSMGKQFTM